MRHLIVTAAAAAALALLTACGSQGTATGTAAAGATSAPAQSCHAQYQAWEHGPARTAAKGLIAQFRAVKAAANASDFPRLDAALKHAGRAAAGVAAYPMPRCADPRRYWPAILTRIRAAADNAGTGSGLGALMLAIVPLKQVPPLVTKLHTEVKQNAGGTAPLK
jgi:hypothetical protein